jgi:hypothetical protein
MADQKEEDNDSKPKGEEDTNQGRRGWIARVEKKTEPV